MAIKSTGGYLLIDLEGKAGLLADTPTFPGIYNKIKESTKPVILTNLMSPAYSDVPAFWPVNIPLVGISEEENFCFGYPQITISGASISYLYFVVVKPNDEVAFVEA